MFIHRWSSKSLDAIDSQSRAEFLYAIRNLNVQVEEDHSPISRPREADYAAALTVR